ncbi:STCJ_EMENI Putative sterigmatocystin biosynthesis fatty acid synthase alpha subunit [Aspergillus nidulans FGSC A4]|uniref:Fatty acid synthase alpha subunit stcJ n=1 Tax=Emericella nidulans (strain FGSC A4 / ATCC 38163 / CBS 112.46 / NRRL 194 / M139) TaxID=227321 RepID=STCJ_EMENI|nr:fatty acid synthase subunit stcJ [Aspergillus nidulans FGSC A4]Q00681.2 RecName: Full=Fatty acid synthase alpha subunit stcJ; Includes: RecName: Full=3-oxoacyl-[acyl-carrier-protein] reductase; AltName: Full=3-oxoacyl-[acyl-carrier-protein] synthase; AltName: Full=Sterigmatocystin biosynthesis cluster protein J [Aspergillus nidulans FGSC A4]EAA61603.1 STCJ_EMENI Putative sterigmatocystin biosynthesis fatty acid synthase alpha subunit [Aspergillus nidulans FGSC A4]CBF80164.1 TPA: Putative ster|eukprot:XP_681084.1 STCJ_EMENI Putative sterigmatocystin biosynthesis fatty acid synthase alpha subunit [Aspergillus nidulans FGSC A4]
MTQKTIQQVPRQGLELLASTQDLAQLCYIYGEPAEGEDSTADESIINTPQCSTIPEVAVEPEVQPIPDTPLTAIFIIRALVARKLRRSETEIDPSRSIKELCGGKSTLQNELIGELGNEFQTSLPDRAEDVSLADLDAALGEVSLGPTSVSLLQRVFTAKMPARMTVSNVRERLAEIWGLGFHRQTAVLVAALAAEPHSRLTSLEAAYQYWDGLTEAYGQSLGLFLRKAISQQAARSDDQGAQAIAPADSLGSKDLARKQYEALREYLGIRTPTTKQDGLDLADLQQKLDCWTAEFSDDFLSQISRRFDARKTRWYRDWWNSARQELLTICQNSNVQWTDKMREHFVQRAEEGLVEIARAHSLAKPLVPDLIQAISLPPVVRLGRLATMMPRTVVTLKGEIQCEEHEREPSCFVEFFSSWIQANNIRCTIQSNGEDLTSVFINSLVHASQQGVSFANHTYLITGAGPGSIGQHIVRRLLTGGARVIVTTSREPLPAAAFFKELYSKCGNRGSQLHLVPFNQASVVDCERLIGYIYDDLGLDLDAILPFAATSQVGAEIDGLDASNEAAFRLMLVNVLRLVGFVVSQKRRRGISCRPTQVVLPLSPNHGILGGDGLYAESKRGLETLIQRFHSESWKEELSICGVSIGWTRSTGLMAANDLVAETAEKQGRVLTFSVDEMGDLISLLLTPQLATRCEDAPVMADFSGNLSCWRDASAQLAAARASLRERADTARALAQEDEREYRCRRAGSTQEPVDQRVSLHLGFPSLPEYDPLLHPDLVPADAVVVVGFAELGPWGSARIRWEMESRGCLSPAGYVETAWLMNLIRHVDNVNYVGWVDGEDGKPVADADIPKRYGERILSNAGIRSLPSDNREVFQEIVLEQDLPSFETTRENAEALQQRHGDMVQVSTLKNGLCLVQLQHGATIRVPKSIMSPPGVAGQLPTGWSPERYGIPAEIVQQVDPVALVLLCCVAEAFYSAGISDPMEIFEHIHLSELGNFVGSSMGGVVNTRALYHDVCLDKDVQSDALQETYLNTAPAWVNMLYLGAAGPIKTPVGACATALESVDSAVESIKAGQTKICLVGGYDDLQPEESAGFARMKATVSVRDEQARGREPGEMSRPTAASRSGFVESQGCGVQLLCRGDVALAMGLPIYGIIAGTGMASDGIGRSVPAPGQGILTFAQEDAQNPAPIRTALARWGLGIDDITVASLHATSTPANDTNEPLVIQREMTHLGRTSGRPLWAICQKFVTGHPKAPAAAWMLNGCLQVLDTGLVPGNRNADDVDPALRSFSHLCFPIRSIQTDGIKAFLLNSCGFGQKEAQLVGVHPRYFLGLLSEPEFEEYRTRRQLRIAGAERAYISAMMTNSIVCVQSHPPFGPAEMHSILLDPSARICLDSSTNSYRVTKASTPVYTGFQRPHDKREDPRPSTIGVDTVTLSSFNAHENAIFLQRNYTERERQSLQLQSHRSFRSAVASGWCAKEAVFKCLQTVSKGAGAAMSEIEIVRVQGAPSVLHGDALAAAQKAGLDNIQLSLSYGDDCVVAVALGVRKWCLWPLASIIR